MGQMGFFDGRFLNRYTGLDAKNEPLATRSTRLFRGKTSVGVWMRCIGARTRRASRRGRDRKPWDAAVKVYVTKTIILSALYNRFVGRSALSIRSGNACRSCGFWGWVWRTGFPMPRQCGLYREQLTQAGVIETLFETFDGHLKDQGLSAPMRRPDQSTPRSWRFPNSATAARRRNAADNRRARRAECWQDKPAKRGRQKDVEARWTPRSTARSALRLQEPCQRGPSAQAGAALSGERRGDARQ